MMMGTVMPGPKMTHAELQSVITQILGYTGWSFLHVRKSIGRGAKWQTTTNISGWPDLGPLWNPRQPGRFLAIEVKVPPDKLRDDQVEVLASLESAGFECYTVKPDDLERLPELLRKGGHPWASLIMHR
jgi:hypothetical protein